LTHQPSSTTFLRGTARSRTAETLQGVAYTR
jgi:hypothetical protein